MAGTKISALTALTTLADGDLVPIVDVSDTTQGPAGSTKKITAANLGSSVVADVKATDDEAFDATSTAKVLTPANWAFIHTAIIAKVKTSQTDTERVAAITAAIDEACGAGNPVSVTRVANRGVEIPAGQWQLNSPIECRSVMGLHIAGKGYCELFANASMESIMDWNGVRNSSLSNIVFRGDTGVEVDTALYVYWDVAESLAAPTQNRYSDIWVRNLDYIDAFRIGKVGTGGAQTDNQMFDNILINGAWTAGETVRYQRGIKLGNGTYGNNLNHHLYHCNINLTRYNFYVDATNASFVGGDVGHGEVDFFLNSTGHCDITGFRSEGSERFAVTGGPAGYPSMISISDINYNAQDMNADGRWIQFKYGGELSLTRIKCDLATIQPLIYTNTSGAPSRVDVNGYVVQGSGAFTPAFVGSAYFSVDAATAVKAKGIAPTNPSGTTLGILDYDSHPTPASRNVATGEVSFDRAFIAANSGAAVSQTVYLCYFTAEKTETINTLTMWTTGTGTSSPTLCQYVVYSVASNGNLTLIHSTTNDTALWAGTNTAYPKALSTAWSKVAGTRYAVGMLYVGAGAPTHLGMFSQTATNISTNWFREPRISAARTGQATPPSSITNANLVDTPRVPYVLMEP